MFFRPKAARRLIDSGKKIIPAYLKAIENDCAHPQRDAVLMFIGYVHFGIMYELNRGRINVDDIRTILAAAALCVRTYAPNHGLEVNYIDSTLAPAKAAVDASGFDPFLWTKEYYEAVQPLTTLDGASFMGLLSADSMKLVSE